MALKQVICKLGNMRKNAEWVVYPKRNNDEGHITIQSDTRICKFDPATKKGVLSAAHANGSYGIHLYPQLGAVAVDIPEDVIAACVEAQPKPGTRIGAGVYVA